MRPALSRVESWQPWALTDIAEDLRAVDEQFRVELDRMRSVIDDAHRDWQGIDYDSAYDRVTDEHTAGRRVSEEVGALADVVTGAADRIQSARQVTLAAVGDARADSWTVGDDWRVTGDDTDACAVHQGLIDRALSVLMEEDAAVAVSLTGALGELRRQSDRVGMGSGAATGPVSAATERGNRDGNELAAAVAGGDPAPLDAIADNLVATGLSADDFRRLAEGGSVSTLDPAVQDYYAELFRTAGKDGLFALTDHLGEQEAAGDTAAAHRLDNLANGLLVVSDEKVGTGLASDQSLISPGAYDNVPQEFRDLIESRITEDGQLIGGVATTDPDYVTDLSRLSDLLQQSNPDVHPGTELGTELYQKAAHMVTNDVAAMRYGESEDFQAHEWAAGNFADIAGRNHESAQQIWFGDGMPDGYDREDTVRALTGHDWSGTDGGRGAATLIDWITDDTQSFVGDPQGDIARRALVDLPHMLAPFEESSLPNADGYEAAVEDDGVAVSETHRESFSRNPELSSALARALAANPDSWITNDVRTDYSVDTGLTADGRPILHGNDANRLLELGSYSNDGRTLLSGIAEDRRYLELRDAFAEHPDGSVADSLDELRSPDIAGRVDAAARAATDYQVEQGVLDHNAQQSLLQFAREGGASVAGELAGAAGVGAFNPTSEVLKKMVELGVGSASEATFGKFLPEPDLREVPTLSENDIATRGRDLMNHTILRAAADVGQLPEDLLGSNGGPVPPGALQTDDIAADAFTELKNARGLGGYVTNYQQTYSNRLAMGTD